jgi:hypothetical protein
VRLYPAGHRARFSTELRQVFALLCRDAYAARGGAGVAALWLPALADLLWTAAVQWINSFGQWRVPQMPKAIRMLEPGLLIFGVAWWGLGSRFFAGACDPFANILLFIAFLPAGYLFAWASRKLPLWAAGTLGLVTLAGLSTGFLLRLEARISGTACFVGIFSPYFVFTGGFFCSALLLTIAARRVFLRPPADGIPPGLVWSRSAGLLLGLALLVLGKSIHTFYWLMVWDSTVDPLEFLWYIPVGVAAIFAAVLLIYTLPWRVKLGGLGFLLLLPALIVAAGSLAGRVEFRALTAARAERLTRAIESYQARTGGYPAALRQLVPWDTLAVGEPVVIPTMAWCYDGGPDDYRLAYVTRDHWSDPNLYPVLVSSAGDTTSFPPACEKEISAYRSQFNWIPFLNWFLLAAALLIGLILAVLAWPAVVWLLKSGRSRWVWPLSLAAFLALLYTNGPAALLPDSAPRWLRALNGVIYTAAPALGVAAAALLLVTGLRRLSKRFALAQDAITRTGQIEGGVRLAAALFLLFFLAYVIAWASIWDQTTDGLSGLMFTSVAIPAAIVCGMLIGLRGPAWQRRMAPWFVVAVSLLAIVGFRWGWDISFPKLTQERAAQVAQALERYRQREDSYPSRLSDLVPRDLLNVPQPVMFRGETWCYQAGRDAYRLAAFSHHYFGLPVSLTVYQSAGDLGEKRPLPCAVRLAEMQARYNWTGNLPLSEK